MSKDQEVYAYGRPVSEVIRDAEWATVRSIRDASLRATDWIVMQAQEVGTEVPADVKAYRQALRDIPQDMADPFSVDWPPIPASIQK